MTFINNSALVKTIQSSVAVFTVLLLGWIFSSDAHAAACVFTDNTNNTISVGCSISGTAGVDNGNLTISGATITIGVPGTPATLFFTPGNSIIKGAGGSFQKAAGSIIQKQYVYYTDSDNDGYALSLTP